MILVVTFPTSSMFLSWINFSAQGTGRQLKGTEGESLGLQEMDLGRDETAEKLV